MEDKKSIQIRQFENSDFPAIIQLYAAEGWSNLVENAEQTKKAWENSNASCVALIENKIVGCVRGITDGHVSLYVCELICSKEYRGLGIGTALLRFIHEAFPETRLELLGSSSSQSYYEKLQFRPYYGFRKTINEW
ncbi:GNAT family N-acetyltransferase [Falsibacillus pallidus]|uniref:GNAT family N-acetyltransferase n=1 Tax=Falsibacillus pallidus TaxID=493781 RepID=UPI003D971EEF